MKKLLTIAVALLTIQVNGQTNQELESKINNLADQIEEFKKERPAGEKVHIGGYGELAYSKTEEGEKDTNGGTPKFDNKRFILYIGYDFSTKWSLVSEIEIEHADEIFMEQAYLNYAPSKNINYRVGTLIIPMGHLNLYHEPTTFFGTQRTESETNIIPSTWRENGLGVYGANEKYSYYLYYVTGLTAKNSAAKVIGSSGIRNGRQKASNADAHKGAFVGRFDFKVTPSVEVGSSVYSGKLNGTVSDVSHNVYDIHYKGQFGAFYTRALWTELTLSNTEDLNGEHATDVGEKMTGAYFELGYNILHGSSELQFIPFVRHEAINTHASVASGLTADKSKDETHQTLGFVVKPLENIVFKADYTKTTNAAKTGTDSWNLGVGWNF